MKIWKIVRDTDYETSADLFTNEADAQTAFDIEIECYREEYGDENDTGPQDPDAVMSWAEGRGCIDLVRLEHDEIKLPPVYESAPELLVACRDALEVEVNMAGNPDSELARRLRAAIAKAEGRA